MVSIEKYAYSGIILDACLLQNDFTYWFVILQFKIKYISFAEELYIEIFHEFDYIMLEWYQKNIVFFKIQFILIQLCFFRSICWINIII